MFSVSADEYVEGLNLSQVDGVSGNVVSLLFSILVDDVFLPTFSIVDLVVFGC